MEGFALKIEYFVEVMGESLQKMEQSVEYIESFTNVTKTEQVQIMQALLELSERIKVMEAYFMHRKY